MRILLFALFLSPTLAQGNYYELGFAGNYRKLNLPSETGVDSFDSTISYTASFAFYFAEMAALEWNYTKGQSERFIPGQNVDSRTIYDFSLTGLDLIFTFADRKASFVPYIKGGLAFFIGKDVTYSYTDHDNPSNNRTATTNLGEALVPSLGFGLKIKMTRTTALKIGMEAWTSDSLDKDPRWDWAGRAGVSWFF